MRALRNVWSELVERRLWPVALLLVAALVAVPLLLAKPAAPEGDGAATGTPVAADAADLREPPDAVVSVDAEIDGQAPLRGSAKDPFKQQHVPKAPSAETAADDGGSGAGTGGGTATPPPPTPQKTYVRAAVDVRFGKAGGTLREIGDVPRLTPLPNAARPVVIFLGMRRDHETAVFLVSTDVNAQGQGRCVPSRKVCEAIELRAGQIALLDVSDEHGVVTQYELDLVTVTLYTTTSAAEARSAYARVSRAGARLLRRRVRTSLNTRGRPQRIPFRYIERSGVLHVRPYASRSHRRAQRGLAAGSRARVVDVAP